MLRTVEREFATFLTQAGTALMGKVLRGEATMAFDKCQVGDGLWSVNRQDQEGVISFVIDVPEQLLSPIENGTFDIEALTDNSKGVTQARVNIPSSFGPATITEVAWLLEDDTVYAVTRYAPLPVMPPDSGNLSEISLRAFLTVGDISAVTLIIDSDISASRDYVDFEVGKAKLNLELKDSLLTERINGFPLSFLVTDPVLTGDVEQSYGNNISLAVSDGVSAWHNTDQNATIDHYEWKLPFNATLSSAAMTWPIPNDPSLVGTSYQFSVRAVDTLGNYSQWVTTSVTVVGNIRPDTSNFTHDIQLIAVRNKAVQAQFSGVIDADGEDSQITYRLSDLVNVSASKVLGIAHDEQITLTYSDTTEDTLASITIIAVDADGLPSEPIVLSIDLRHSVIVNQPQGLAPAGGATDIAQQPQVAANAFSTNPIGHGNHTATRIRLATDLAMTNIISAPLLANVTSSQVALTLDLDTQYYWQIQYEAGALGWSQWSEPLSFHTIATILPQDVFSSTKTSGNGGNQKITNGMDLTRYNGLVFGKSLDSTQETLLVDSVRGANQVISSSENTAQTLQANTISQFETDGFSVGNSSKVNGIGLSYVFSAFREAEKFLNIIELTLSTGANNGTRTPAASIDSIKGATAVINGDGTVTIDHNLNCDLGLVLYKVADAGDDFFAQHRSVPSLGRLSSQAPFSGAAHISEMNAASFKINDAAFVGDSRTQTIIMYAFAHDPSSGGLIQCGSYLGGISQTYLYAYSSQNLAVPQNTAITATGRGGSRQPYQAITGYSLSAEDNQLYAVGSDITITQVTYSYPTFLANQAELDGQTITATWPAQSVNLNGFIGQIPAGSLSFTASYSSEIYHNVSLYFDFGGHMSPQVVRTGAFYYKNRVYETRYNKGQDAELTFNGTVLKFPGQEITGSHSYTTINANTGAAVSLDADVRDGGNINVQYDISAPVTVSTGVETQMLLITNISSEGGWILLDDARGMDSANDKFLDISSNAIEVDGGEMVTPTQNAFQVTGTDNEINRMNDTFIYMAIRAPIPV